MSWRLSGQFPGVETMSYTGCRGGAEEGGRGGGGGFHYSVDKCGLLFGFCTKELEQ